VLGSYHERDVLKINALDQWCLQKLLGIKWYHRVWNDELRWTTKKPHLSAVVQARMPDETDTKKILIASPYED